MKYASILFLFTSSLFAQNVTPLTTASVDATLLMANFAATNNVIDISNVNIVGADYTIGTFDGFVNFPAQQGLVLSTGGAEWALAPINGSVGSLPGNNNAVVDPHLESLATSINQPVGQSTFFNTVAIEFDFIPQFDAISFDYVFASKEYQDFTCSSFNDVFGFFLSGPGISGNYYNGSKNIAVVPGSNNTPVCINSINSGSPSGSLPISGCTDVDQNFLNYSYLFNQNDPNTDVPFPFNGYTASLSIIDSLIPDSTYHLKIVISDVADGALNSAVFLTANSFSSFPVESIVWGCTDASATNYSPTANFNDGSCEFGTIGLDELEELEDVLSTIINPISGDELTISGLGEHMDVSVYTLAGNKVVQSKEQVIDISTLQSGLYIVEISNGNQRKSGKFVKL